MKRVITIFSLLVLAVTSAWADSVEKTSIKLSNLPEKYNFAEAFVVTYNDNEQQAINAMWMSKMKFVAEEKRDQASCGNWDDYYGILYDNASPVKVADNKCVLETEVYPKSDTKYFVLGFMRDGFVCGGAYEMAVAEGVLEEDGSYTVSSLTENTARGMLREYGGEMPLNWIEEPITARMGKMKYTNGKGAYVYVDDNGMLISADDEEESPLCYFLDYAADGDDYVGTSPLSPMTFRFVVKDGRVTEIVCKMGEDVMTLKPDTSEGVTYSAVSWMMGETQYVNNEGERAQFIYSNGKGGIIYGCEGKTNEIKNEYAIQSDGNDLVGDYLSEEENKSIRFVVNEGKVTKIVITGEESVEEFLPTETNYLTLTVNKGFAQFYVTVFFGGDESGYGMPSPNYPKIMFSINGGLWFTPEDDFRSIYMDKDGNWIGEFLCETWIEAGDVLRIRGDNVSLHSNENGAIQLYFFNYDDPDITMSGNASSMLDGVGQDGTQPSLDYFFGNGLKYIKAAITTEVETIDVQNKTNTYKTIENGKVVIVKNGVKYDIMGRKM